jgi:hypothetical protein
LNRVRPAGTVTGVGLEDRVTALERGEQETRHAVTAGLGAHSHALSLLHTEITGFRQEMGQFRDDVRQEFDEVKARLGGIETALAQIAARLPQPPT